MVLGTAQAQAGRTQEALKTLERASRGWANIGNQGEMAKVDLYVAALWLQAASEGDDAAPDLAKGLTHKAVAVLRVEGIRSGQALGLLLAAEAHLFLEEFEDAVQKLTEADHLAKELGIPDLLIRASCFTWTC